jgi:hypothetical protein
MYAAAPARRTTTTTATTIHRYFIRGNLLNRC